MIQLAIHVDLLPDKLNEFNQSWETFIQHKNTIKGLTWCHKNNLGNHSCDIILQCNNQRQMDLFMQSEWYNFLMGAIQTLGDKSETKQIQHNKE